MAPKVKVDASNSLIRMMLGLTAIAFMLKLGIDEYKIADSLTTLILTFDPSSPGPT